MESIVCQAVVEDSYGDFDSPDARLRYLRALSRATDELYRLSGSKNVDYGLRGMGEAYALWYHMRRVANIYAILTGFEEDLLRSSPSAQWRILDVGAGTGAASMAVAHWMSSRGFSLGREVQTRILCLEPEDAMLEVADLILRRIAAVTGSELELFRTRHNERCLAAAAQLPGSEVFEIALFSTTFDYIFDPSERQTRIAEIIRVLDRLLPDGLAFFLVPKKELKRTLLHELSEVLLSSGKWRRLRNFGLRPRDWPDDGAPQEVIREARSYLHGEGERLRLYPPIFTPERESRHPPSYRYDVDAWVFRKEPTYDIGRRFRWDLARRRIEASSRF